MKSFTIYMKDLEEGGLWDNIHKRRKAGKAPKKPGDKGYPKTLDIEGKAYGPTGVSYSDEPNLVSTMMGYSTGCCKCFHVSKVNELLGLPEGKDTVLLMGIGIADPSRQRQEHHTDASFSFGSHKNMRTFETHYA